ncbi:MAG: MerR family transcriptional regulator [Xanthobacteraceae bacterium]
MDKAPDAFRTISEVADDLDIPQHVLRFWETRFTQIKPMKRSGGRRYYRPDDVDLLRGIRRLLYGEGYTIRGVQRILREQGLKSVQGLADASVPPPTPARHAERDDDTAVKGGEPETDFETDEDGLEVDVTPRPAPPSRSGAAAPAHVSGRDDRHGAVRPGEPKVASPARGLSTANATRLRAALEDLTACKKLVDDALKAIPPDLFPLK